MRVFVWVQKPKRMCVILCATNACVRACVCIHFILYVWVSFNFLFSFKNFSLFFLLLLPLALFSSHKTFATQYLCWFPSNMYVHHFSHFPIPSYFIFFFSFGFFVHSFLFIGFGYFGLFGVAKREYEWSVLSLQLKRACYFTYKIMRNLSRTVFSSTNRYKWNNPLREKSTRITPSPSLTFSRFPSERRWFQMYLYVKWESEHYGTTVMKLMAE